MYIYHDFPSTAAAGTFAAVVLAASPRTVHLCPDQDASNRIDPFPLELTGPIVLVERSDSDGATLEQLFADLAGANRGEYAGT